METTITPVHIWRRIKLGTGLKTADDFRGALKTNDFRIGDSASDILGKPAFTAAEQELEVDLLRMSLKDIGFNGNACYNQICTRAKEMGLELCPAEVGPQLLLQYVDQSKYEWFVIAMEAIRDSYGDLRVFCVEYGCNGRGLYGHCGNPVYVWGPDYEFLFVSKK